ncbi:phytanoyl-CoA dioxygenase family protein [Protofrankia coriariae]|uniref:Phytanoyl-CoA dioxygenase n=1 Tax=Protofrankia coriariae TaxID=1562887 RepID=A0ABR5F086_9ACTN|nr:phytanoyl-CoA dioxygenase family protein [Protofrankia coriariae]KLL10107.1 phytanoyl-CoA dioxygenase [Protofrankia coriariae]
MTTARPVSGLASNGAAIPFNDTYFAPMTDSSDLLAEPAALRERLRRDGHLLLRGVLDPDEVLRLREQYFAQLDPGFLAPGTPPVSGVYSGTVPAGTGEYGVPGHPAHSFVRSPQFQRFSEQPVLRRLAETLLQGPVQLLPRKIVRHFYLGSLRASRAHTDYEYMTRGTDQLLTTWIPLGDCPLPMGGLIYLEGSHTLTPDQLDPLRDVTDRPHDSRPISHDLRWTAERTARRWLWADYATGDLTIHTPHIVHASLDTGTRRMRLSADIRFQLAGARTDSRWTRPWSADDGA